MKMKKLIREQLDNKIIKFNELDKVVVPPNGWIYSIRQGINMSLRQLGQRLSITPQSVKEIEEREKNGTISIKVLKQVASALNMQFVYGFVPKDKTLDGMIDDRLLVMKAEKAYAGKLEFDIPRHKIYLGFEHDWPRMNTIPEWYTVQPQKTYTVRNLTDKSTVELTGKQLREGLPVKIQAGTEIRLLIRIK